MSLLRTDATVGESRMLTEETETLRRQIDALKGRLCGLSEASVRIAESDNVDPALREVVNSA